MSIASLTLRVRKNTEQAKPVTLSNETPAWDKVYARPAGHVVKRLDNIPTRQRGAGGYRTMSKFATGCSRCFVTRQKAWLKLCGGSLLCRSHVVPLFCE